jgi:hypothetical protein
LSAYATDHGASLDWAATLSGSGRGHTRAIISTAPITTAAILNGHQPAGLTSTTLVKRAELPISWSEQRRTFGFA